MGFSYRKSLNLGPFRVNVGQGGIGWSFGAGGFRSGVSSRGRRYSTFSLPNTGMSYRTSGGMGCLSVLALGMLGGTGIYWLVSNLLA